MDTIEQIATEHSSQKKTFGYFDQEDLHNEIWVICLEKIHDFDETRGKLEHFLRVTVKNRLINKFKDVTKNVVIPCTRCPHYLACGVPSDCLKFGVDKHQCGQWNRYLSIVGSRNSLLNPVSLEDNRVSNDKVIDKICAKEFLIHISGRIDSSHRRDFDAFVSGSRLTKKRETKLYKYISTLIRDDSGVPHGSK